MLYEEFMTQCTLVSRSSVPDGEGGSITAWTDGAVFDAAIVMDNSTSVVIADRPSNSSTFTVTVPIGTGLAFHDVFRRNEDGKIFRVVSDGTERHTPTRSSFQFEQTKAEEWEIPDGQ